MRRDAGRLSPVRKSTSELGYPYLHAIELTQLRGRDIASMAWNLDAVEQTQLRRQHPGGTPEI